MICFCDFDSFPDQTEITFPTQKRVAFYNVEMEFRSFCPFGDNTETRSFCGRFTLFRVVELNLTTINREIETCLIGRL